MSSPTPAKQPLAATKEMQSMFAARPTAGGAATPMSSQSPLSTQAYGQPALSAANNNASNAATPAAGHPYPATSAYGQPAYPGKGQGVASPAASYGSAYPNGSYGSAGSAYGSSGSAYGSAGSAYPATGGSPYASSGGGASAVGKTTAYGMPALSNWQPSTLPVSPWSTISPGGGGPLGGGVDTTTILRTDLKALKRSRLKGWGYLMVTLGIFAGAAYFGGKKFLEMRKELSVAKQQLGEATKAATAPLAAASVPGAVATAPVTSPATTKLNEDLKKSLAGLAGVTVETRGDRVVIAMDQGALFEGNELEASLGGYKVLYKMFKAMKPVVKDRRVVITVPGDAKKGKTWNVAAARAVSLGRNIIEDVGVDSHKVISTAPGAPQGGGGRHVEFSLEPAPEATKS